MNTTSNNQTTIPHSYNLSFIYRFFCWCSGARLYLLRSCPTDYNKFFGVGITVFLTGVLASFTGSYALFITFKSLPVAILFGIFWGILIFFLDWFIVSSLRKENKIISELLFAFPRIILAVLLAIVISRPLELKLFEKEINGMLQNIQSENSIKYNQLVDKEFDDIRLLKEENQRLSSEIAEKEKYRNQLYNTMIEEAEGKSGTLRVGKGLVYNEKRSAYEKVDSELEQLKQKNEKLIDQNLKTLAVLEQNKINQISKSSEEIKQADGLLARFEAMSELTKKNKAVNYASWFIFILFILIEASPILVKLLSQRGPYDELFEKEEYEKLIEYKKQKVKAKILANNYLELLKQKDELQIAAEKRNNENLIKDIEDAKNEINRLYIGKWKQKEIEAINQMLEENKPEIQNEIQNEIDETIIDSNKLQNETESDINIDESLQEVSQNTQTENKEQNINGS